MGSEWQTFPLEECMDAIIDYRGKTPKKTSAGVPLITAKIVKNGSIQPAQEFIAEDDYVKWMRRGIPQAGDVLLTTEAPLGQVAQLDSFKVALAQRLITLRGKSGFLDNTFLKFLMQSDLVQNQLRARSTGTTVIGIKQKELRKVILLIPPLPEQHAIAHILGSLDDKIELNRRMNKTLEAIARAIFKSWFIDFDPVIDNALRAGNPIPDSMAERAEMRRRILDQNQPSSFSQRAKGRNYQEGFDFSGLGEISIDEIYRLFPDSFQDSELGPIPKGWEVKSLDQIANYLNGLACQKYPPEGGKPSLPVIKIRELHQGITENTDRASSDVPDEYIIDDGDILFSWSGSLIIDIWTQGKGVLNQHLYKVTSKNYPKWFYYYWTDHHLIEFQRIAAYKATTMGHIKRHHLTDAKCCISDDDVMKIADEEIAPLFMLRIKNELEVKKLTSLRDTLLPKLISGELLVPDAEKFIEEGGV